MARRFLTSVRTLAPEPTAAPAAAAAAQDALEGKVADCGHGFAGGRTAGGQRFNPNALSMAHETLPSGAVLRVANLMNGSGGRFA